MAMILEVVGVDGRRTWHRLADLPLRVGRALSNDLILDDPYVDACHARLVPDASGALRLEDLGSVNGLVAGGARLHEAIAVRPGDEVRIGRTTLRFREADEPMAPALIDASDVGGNDVDVRGAIPVSPVAPAVDAPVPAAPSRWFATTAAQLAIFLAVLGVVALQTWLGNTARSGASSTLGVVLALAFLMVLWAGAWAAAGRVTLHRFRFVAHLALASVVLLGASIASTLEDWLAFLLPDATAVSVLSVGSMLGVLLALVVGHLALASSLSRRRRWQAGLAVIGVVLAVASLAALVRDDEFSDVPKFPAQLKPLAPEWLPTATVDEFGGALRELRVETDSLATKEVSAESR